MLLGRTFQERHLNVHSAQRLTVSSRSSRVIGLIFVLPLQLQLQGRFQKHQFSAEYTSDAECPPQLKMLHKNEDKIEVVHASPPINTT